MHGPQAQATLLQTLGIPAQYAPEVNLAAVQQKVAQGGVAAISTPNHYFFIQGYDPNTGLYDTGNSGTAYRNGKRYMTADEIRQLGGGSFSGQYLSTEPGAQNPAAAPIAQNAQPQISVDANGRVQGLRGGVAQQSYQPQPSTAQIPESLANNPLVQQAIQVAQQHGIDPGVFVRQIQQESGFNPNAVSPAGARGIAQLMPQWWQGKFDPNDPNVALPFAANLMSTLLQKYNGDYRKALAAYNAGEGAVDKYGGVPPYQETQAYIQHILGDGNGVWAQPMPQPPGQTPNISQFPLPNARPGAQVQMNPMAKMFGYTGQSMPGVAPMPIVQMGQTAFTPFGQMRTEFGQDSMQPPTVNYTPRLIS
jgi:hypothetical protein